MTVASPAIPTSETASSKVEQSLVAWRSIDSPIERYLFLRRLQRCVCAA